MKLHANAALSLTQRRRMVGLVCEDGWSIQAAAAEFTTSSTTCSTWVSRFREASESGLLDRSSACDQVANRTDERRIEAIALFAKASAVGARDRRTARDAGVDGVGDPRADRDGKLGRLGIEPAQRYERERPGELMHIDVKKLGRIHGGAGKRITGTKRNPGRYRADAHVRERKAIGWDYVHVAIDDATRLAYAEVLPDESAATAIGFLRRALAHFASYGITVERVLTDNGSPYRSTLHAIACRALGIRHLRTRPRRPQTNGKAERFIRTMLGGWAYGAIYSSSRERTAALDGWLFTYNHRRRHAGIGRQTPITRLNNLLGTYS
jgi:transposase InsO family protein